MQNIPSLLQQLIDNRICFEKILFWRAWIGRPTTELTKATDDRKRRPGAASQPSASLKGYKTPVVVVVLCYCSDSRGVIGYNPNPNSVIIIPCFFLGLPDKNEERRWQKGSLVLCAYITALLGFSATTLVSSKGVFEPCTDFKTPSRLRCPSNWISLLFILACLFTCQQGYTWSWVKSG